MRRQPIPGEQLRDLSGAIWLGLGVLTVSGAVLFGMNPSKYLHNGGFVAKMIVVAVLMLNGLLLHGRLATFRPSALILLAGAVSSVSWYGSLAIAMFKAKVGLSLVSYLSLYALAIVIVWRIYVSLFAKLGRAAPGQGAAPQPATDQALRQQSVAA